MTYAIVQGGSIDVRHPDHDVDRRGRRMRGRGPTRVRLTLDLDVMNHDDALVLARVFEAWPRSICVECLASAFAEPEKP